MELVALTMSPLFPTHAVCMIAEGGRSLVLFVEIACCELTFPTEPNSQFSILKWENGVDMVIRLSISSRANGISEVPLSA